MQAFDVEGGVWAGGGKWTEGVFPSERSDYLSSRSLGRFYWSTDGVRAWMYIWS